MKRCKFTKIVAGLSVVASIMGTTAFAEDTRIALVVKALGIGFFEAAAKGAEEAAAEAPAEEAPAEEAPAEEAPAEEAPAEEAQQAGAHAARAQDHVHGC